MSFLGVYIYIYKNIHFLVHGHSFWSMFGLHLVRGPKPLKIAFFIYFFQKSDHGSVTIKKCHLGMEQLYVPCCKQPLRPIFLT